MILYSIHKYIRYSDITTGVLLGQGAFSTVREVKGFSPLCQESQLQLLQAHKILDEDNVDEIEKEELSSLASMDGTFANENTNTSIMSKSNSMSTIASAEDMEEEQENQQNEKQYSYAIKAVRSDLSRMDRYSAFMDLECEAVFLTQLSHRHIIKMQ